MRNSKFEIRNDGGKIAYDFPLDLYIKNNFKGNFLWINV